MTVPPSPEGGLFFWYTGGMDLGLMQLVQAWHPDWLTQVTRLVSVLSDTPSYFFAVPVVAAAYFRHGRRRLAAATVLVTAGNLLNPLIKSIVERPRPTTDIVSVLEQANKRLKAVERVIEEDTPVGQLLENAVFPVDIR